LHRARFGLSKRLRQIRGSDMAPPVHHVKAKEHRIADRVQRRQRKPGDQLEEPAHVRDAGGNRVPSGEKPVSVDEFFDRGNLDAVTPVAEGIDLWWCALERAPEETDRLAAWLSPAEHARAARFGTNALRRRWIAGRAALRFVLGRTLGVAPAAVPIRRGVRGRPELADSGVALDFNVSHTRGVALIGIAGRPSGTRIGVDVNGSTRRRRRPPGTEVPYGSRTIGDRGASPSCAGSARTICKEAMSKATGDGLIAPFGKLEVGSIRIRIFSTGRRLIRRRRNPRRAGACWLFT
jgi:phosphopantetheinyl transferase